MAVKGICCLTNVQRDSSNHSHFIATVQYASLTDVSAQGAFYIYDLDPSALGTTLTDTIQSAIKTELTNAGVSFGLLDSVRLMPGLV